MHFLICAILIFLLSAVAALLLAKSPSRSTLAGVGGSVAGCTAASSGGGCRMPCSWIEAASSSSVCWASSSVVNSSSTALLVAPNRGLAHGVLLSVQLRAAVPLHAQRPRGPHRALEVHPLPARRRQPRPLHGRTLRPSHRPARNTKPHLRAGALPAYSRSEGRACAPHAAAPRPARSGPVG